MEMNSTGMQYQTTFPLGFAPAEPAATPQTQTNTIQLAETCRPECTFQRRWSLLNELRQRHEYCDLMLVSSDKVTFQAHSLVLASSSSFLHTAIQTLRSESYSTSGPQKLSIDGVGSDVLGIVLDCLYGVMPSILEDVLKLRMGAEALGLNSYFWPESNKTLTVEQTTIERQTPKSGKQMSNFAEEETDDINARTSDGLPLALAGTSKQRPEQSQQQQQQQPQEVATSDPGDFNPFRNMLTIESIIMGSSNIQQGTQGFEQIIADPNQQMYATTTTRQQIPGQEQVVIKTGLEEHMIPELGADPQQTVVQQQQQVMPANTLTIQNPDGSITHQTIDMEAKARKVKRRQSNPDLWARKQRKWKKDRGEEYVTRSGKVIAAISRTGPPCTDVCPLRCNKRITEEECNELFNQFYTLANKNKQDAYLYSLINRIEPARRTSNAPVRIRNHSFTYHVRKKEGTLIRVCKHAFSSIFGVKDSRLHRLQNHRAKPAIESTGPPVDRRGKHTNQKKIPEEIKIAVRKHILAYIAANKASGQSDNALRVKSMWLDCIRVNEPNQFEMIQMGLKYAGKISQNLYKSLYCKEFKPYLDITEQKPQPPPPPAPTQMIAPTHTLIHSGHILTQ